MIHPAHTLTLLASAIFLAAPCGAIAQEPSVSLAIARLRCELAENPLGVDLPNPRLSWIVESDARGQRQTAYQILVASTNEALASDNGDLWDSGRVESDETLHVPYDGGELQSSQQVFW